ncbi:MAG: mycothione reductase [Planctomycetota bacterium]|jgi:mycothione reductase
MSTTKFDLIVLGGGNAITVAIKAAQAGKSVAVIEKDLLGGACPNRGCIPSKLYLGFADAADHIRESSRFYIEAEIKSIDQKRILNEVADATIRATDGKIAKNLPESIELIRGDGRFVSDHKIAIGDREVEGDTILIGTGSRPFVPSTPGIEGSPYWTSDDVFDLDHAPDSITIVGGGYIACELGQFFQGIGVETTLLVRGDTMLRNEDKEIRAVFQPAFSKKLNVKLNTSIKSVTHDAGKFSFDLDEDGTGVKHSSEALLFAVGRKSNADEIGLEKTAIKVSEKGHVVVDEFLQTTVKGVYALGDVIGSHQFTHSAAFAATYMSNVLLEGHDAPLCYPPMPHAVFSSPEIAGVGLTEDELEGGSENYHCASLPYTSAAKGRAVKEMNGLCKFILADDGRILGCHIVGYQASVLIHEVIPVMMWRNHISSLTEIIHIHPSLSEVVRNTARKAAAML